MEKFTTKNNIPMIKCKPLNWEVSKKYNTDSIPNPEVYSIHVGSLSEMWLAYLPSDTMILSFSSTQYSNDEVHKFKVSNLEEASELVMKFVKGMEKLEDIKNTIYDNFS